MSVTFPQWRAEVLQRVHRLISIMSSQEVEYIGDQETTLIWFFFNIEMKSLQELADTPPRPLESDAVLGLFRLRWLCKTWSAICDDIKSADDFPWIVNCYLDAQASPAGIAQLKRIVNLLANAEPRDTGHSTCAPSIVERETPSWNKETMTLSYNGRHIRLRPDAKARSVVFNWFQEGGWKKVKIQGLNIIEDADQVNNLVRRAKQTAQEVGFVITRNGEELVWTSKHEKEKELRAELTQLTAELRAMEADRDYYLNMLLNVRAEVEELRKEKRRAEKSKG
jgi:hypothetical protein